MTITVNTSASRPDFTLLGIVKSELDIDTAGDDALLANYIRRASKFVETYTGRKFARETVTETLPAYGNRKLLLTRRPIVSITYVKHNGTTISSTNYRVHDADAGVLWHNSGWTSSKLHRTVITQYPTGEADNDWEVKYVAGYITPGSTEGESNLPAEIEFATAQVAKAWYLSKDQNPNVKSQKVGDASETMFEQTGGGMTGIPPVALTILNNWRSIDISV